MRRKRTLSKCTKYKECLSQGRGFMGNFRFLFFTWSLLFTLKRFINLTGPCPPPKRPLFLIKKGMCSGAGGTLRSQPPWGRCPWGDMQTSEGPTWRYGKTAPGSRRSGPVSPVGSAVKPHPVGSGEGGSGSEALTRVSDSDPRE